MSVTYEASRTEAHAVSHYLKIWVTILVLFVISISVAQMVDSRPVVLITAFGIAIIQGILVAAYFMHLNEEKTYITYMLLAMLLALFILYMGTLVDEDSVSGLHWVAEDSAQLIKAHEGNHEGHAAHAAPAAEHAPDAATGH